MAGGKGRWWLLLVAVLMAAGIGAAYVWKWRGTSDAMELMEFFTVYLAIPSAVCLLVLFAYFRRPGNV